MMHWSKGRNHRKNSPGLGILPPGYIMAASAITPERTVQHVPSKVSVAHGRHTMVLRTKHFYTKMNYMEGK